MLMLAGRVSRAILTVCCCLSLGLLQALLVAANPDAKRLCDDVLVKRDYNSLIRPVSNHTNTLTVHLGLKLAQLIDIDERNQIMTTNVWVKKIWSEPRLRWNPKDYGGLNQFMLPSADLWLPDVVMFNTADGNYEVNKDTKAMLHSNGMVVWEPPAIFRSSCQIDVEFFPFDKQRCVMKFGSWTYDGLQVDLKHVSMANSSSPLVDYGIDLDGFHESTEWDVLHVPARRNQKIYPCCPEPYPDITFTIVLRRKTLFYTVNLIFPCVAISFLTLFVFYLPSDSGEKTTLCISILIAVTFFFLVLAESIPPTSLVVPLLGKYLLFTMVLVTLSIVITVVEMNFNERTPATHRMSPWTRKIFLEVLPKLLLITRPTASEFNLLNSGDAKKPPAAAAATATTSASKSAAAAAASAAAAGAGGGDSECGSWRLLQRAGQGGGREWRHLSGDHLAPLPPPEAAAAPRDEDDDDAAEDVSDDSREQERREASLRRRMVRDLESLLRLESSHQQQQRHHQPQHPLHRELPEPGDTWQMRPDFVGAAAAAADPASDPRVRRDIRGALRGVQFIAKHMRGEVIDKQKIDDWKFITRVLDRLFLLLFSIVCILGTLGMFLQAPSLYDSEMPIDARNMTYRMLRINTDGAHGQA